MSQSPFRTAFLSLLTLARAADFTIQVDDASSGSGSGSSSSSSSSPGYAPPVLDSFVSYSIEFSSFPDFAGNLSTPNIFSNNLLNNIGNITGSKPIIRVGGNTQDYALYDPNLKSQINGTFTPAAADYPTIIFIGKSYFESYQTWPNTRFVHGFNMAGNTSQAHDTLVTTAGLACKALSGGKFLEWELGNEPDLFSKSAQFNKRPPNYNETDYVKEWLNKTRIIKSVVSKQCPDLPYGYYAPSFAGLNNYLNDTKTWAAGLDADRDIRLISQHNYISGATSPGVTLAHTLLNHTMTLQSLSQYIPSRNKLTAQYRIPYILGETNSLYNQGKPGLSNSFGAALWGLDYNLLAASLGIPRVHMHMGTNYRYQAWQPIETNNTVKGTKAPYYGSIAVANALGNIANGNPRGVRVQNIPLNKETQAAYAVFEGNAVKRVVLINMQQYNYTDFNTGMTTTQRRGNSTYTVNVGRALKDGTAINVQRLLANGSDALSGITWDGYSYNYELKNGMPVRLGNVTTGEKAVVRNGKVTFVVPDSSAALLSLA